MAVSLDARKALIDYGKALKSAESLFEQDTRACNERLETAENSLEVALATVDETRHAIHQKDQTISGLQQTIEFIVRELGSFIHDNLRQSIEDTQEPRAETVKEIIANHSSTHHNDTTASVRYLRIMEQSYLGDFAKFRAAEAKILQYQKLARDQDNLIKSQSAQLDEWLLRYEQCINKVKERDHEIHLLVKQTEKYQTLIDDYGNGTCVCQSTRAVQERLCKQNDDMIKSMKLEHTKQLEDRDAEIANLRQKLGRVREEVLAGETDVKNVTTYTQALLSPVDPLAQMTFGGHAAKERSLLTKENAKGHSPNSMSMASLPFFASPKINFTAALDDYRLPDKEIISTASKLVPRMVPRIEKPEWACGIKKKSSPDLRQADDSFPDLGPRLRNDSQGLVACDFAPSTRTDFLGVVANGIRNFGMQTADTESSVSPINTHKDLPNIPPTVLHHDAQDAYYDTTHQPQILDAQNAYHGTTHQPQIPDAPPHGLYAHIPHYKRVMSNIPEMSSVAASDSGKDNSPSLSMTSSDREAYRKSLDALDLIEFMLEGDLRDPRLCRPPIPPPDYEGWSYGEDKEGAETDVANTAQVDVGRVGTGIGT